MYSESTNNGMVMPVAPYYGNGGNDGMFGGNWMWFLLVWMAMFGWGNGGFGVGGNGNGYVVADVQRGFDQSALTSGINGIQQSITTGFAQAEIAANGRQMADMNQNFGIQTALQNGFCENRAATADLKYTVANEAAATRAASASDRQIIMDKLCQLEMDDIKRDYENRIANMQNTIDQLRDINNQARSAAAFNALGDRFQASQDLQTTALEQYLAPVPRPAFIVQNPNCCQNFGYGGCGSMAA